MREVRLDEDKTGVFGVGARNPTGPFQVHRLRLVKRAERKQDEAETDGYRGNVG
jgi:hypothetical protein